MNSLATIIGIGGHTLLWSAIVLRLAYACKLKGLYPRALANTMLIAALLPIGAMPLAQVTRGIFGDLSITSMMLLGYFLLFPMGGRNKSRQLFILVLIVGILFYPAALGLGMIDPYQWGYLNAYRGMLPPMLFLTILLAIALLAVRLNNALILLCIAMATGAFLLEAMESRNIWDYLIDPLLVIFGLTRVSISSITYLTGKYRAQPDIHH